MPTLAWQDEARHLEAVLRAQLFPKGRPQCPFRKGYRIRHIEHRWHCARCRRKFSLISSTWLKHMKIPLPIFARILSAWVNGRSVKDAAQEAAVSIPTIRRYYALFRISLVTPSFQAEGSVQVDEAYFGQFKKQANYHHGRLTYRVQEKTCVFGMICPQTGMLYTRLVRKKPGKTIKRIIRKEIPRDIVVYSDKSPYYTHLRDTHTHHARTHDEGFGYSQRIESAWSALKRMLFKQYHHFTRRYAREYVAELTWRFNMRKSAKNPIAIFQNSLSPVPYC